ncbi:MAG: methylmalonyl-CoA epimerase [Cytophagales bacterium]|nr:methylmalonyl-CoA epimerase [Cytophagales bacterium]
MDHVGVAVEDWQKSLHDFAILLGTEASDEELLDKEGVRTAFFQTGNTRVELLGATRAESPVGKFLSRRGEGLHHIAFAVKNLDQTLIRLQEKGFSLTSGGIRKGSGGKRICFLQPKQTHGILIELCEKK